MSILWTVIQRIAVTQACKVLWERSVQKSQKDRVRKVRKSIFGKWSNKVDFATEEGEVWGWNISK